MLDGEDGPGTQVAMEIIVALARIYDAEDLIPVSSCQVSGVSYENIGEAGVDFLESLRRGGCKTRVLATLNPCGLDIEDWAALGFSRTFHDNQARVLDAYTGLGLDPTCSCIPYELNNCPAPGEHVAWSESSAVSYVNSVIGAMTNREGGPSALASALTGFTGNYGLHLQANRVPTMHVRVNVPVRTHMDFGALGLTIGKFAGQGVPYLSGLDPAACTPARLRQMGAAMGASGAVALYHVEGVTPGHARHVKIAESQVTVHDIDDLSIESLPDGASHGGKLYPVDLVFLGCPHYTRDQVESILDEIKGRDVRAKLWLAVPRPVKRDLLASGAMNAIDPRVMLVADTCLVVCPVDSLDVHNVVTDSGKAYFYLKNKASVQVAYMDTARCLDAARSGYLPEWHDGEAGA